MPITSEQLRAAQRILASEDSVRSAATRIREQLAPVKALVIDAFDMKAEKAVLQVDSRSMYLMRTDGHCWQVTDDASEASALVLTQA